jgi:hypothetical protein
MEGQGRRRSGRAAAARVDTGGCIGAAVRVGGSQVQRADGGEAVRAVRAGLSQGCSLAEGAAVGDRDGGDADCRCHACRFRYVPVYEAAAGDDVPASRQTALGTSPRVV